MWWDERFRWKQGSFSIFDLDWYKKVPGPPRGSPGGVDVASRAVWPGRWHTASSSKMQICKQPLGWTLTLGAQGQEIIHFCCFIMIPQPWKFATAVTGNVRAVGLPTPACHEWSTMWGENQRVLFREVRADRGLFYAAANKEGNVEVYFSLVRKHTMQY